MILQEIAPAPVAKRGSFLRRADNIGKENGGEHPINWNGSARTGQELLNGIGDLAGAFADKRNMIGPRKLDVAGAGNVPGKIGPPSTLIVVSSVRWITSVGTRIVGTIALISI